MPVCIMRIWKRDGTKNYMGVEDAVLNLEQNALLKLHDDQRENRDRTRKALLRGNTLETPLAWFVLEPGSADALAQPA